MEKEIEDEDKKEVKKEVEVSAEDAKSIAKEMVKEYMLEMKKSIDDRKEIDNKVSNKIVKSNVVVRKANKYSYFGKLKAYKDTELEQAYDDGMWFLATQKNNSAAKQYCEEMGIKAMSEGTNSEGGYTVPNQLIARVIRLVSEYGLGRQISNVFPATSDTVWIPKANGNTEAYFITENAEKKDSDPVFSQVEVIVKKLVVLTKISDELIEDSVINVIDYVVDNMARAIAQKEDEVIFLGSGGADDGGITGIITAIEAVDNNHSIIEAATAGWNNIVLADFTRVMGRLRDYAYVGRDPVWICGNSFYHSVMNRIKGEAGGNYIGTLEGGFKKEFLGYEVKTTAIFPATDNSNPSRNEDYCLFGRGDLVAAFANRHTSRIKTTQEGDAFVYNQTWIRLEERFGYTVHDQGSDSAAGSMILLRGIEE